MGEDTFTCDETVAFVGTVTFGRDSYLWGTVTFGDTVTYAAQGTVNCSCQTKDTSSARATS